MGKKKKRDDGRLHNSMRKGGENLKPLTPRPEPPITRSMVEQDKEYDIACEISDDAFLGSPPLDYRRENGSIDKHKVRLLINSVEKGSIYFTGAYHEKRKSDYLRFLKSL